MASAARSASIATALGHDDAFVRQVDLGGNLHDIGKIGVREAVLNKPGPLTDEFSRMLGEVRAGASRVDAMRNMEKRVNIPELRSFVLAIIQADTFGVSIGRVLRAQAEEMRLKRKQLAEEKAQKVTVKILFPLIFGIMPVLFVVIIGPGIIQAFYAFQGT